MSLAIGLLALLKPALPALDQWTEGRDLLVSCALLATLFVAFCVAIRSGRKDASTLSTRNEAGAPVREARTPASG